MKIGIPADIHESLTNLRWTINVLREQGVDRLVVLGDVFELGHGLKETVDLLAEVGAIGVWGNHDFRLCRDNPRTEDRELYGERVLAFMSSLKPLLLTLMKGRPRPNCHPVLCDLPAVSHSTSPPANNLRASIDSASMTTDLLLRVMDVP
jgi:hypothetical protein